MRLDEPIEKSGFFWLPNSPENRFPGNLRIDEFGKVSVELMGFLGDELFAPQDLNQLFSGIPAVSRDIVTRILGVVRDVGHVTLENCDGRGFSLNIGSGPSWRTFYPELAVMGALFNEGEPLEFSEVGFTIQGLETWLSISGISFEQDFQRSRGSINFEVPEPVAINLLDGMTLEFGFGLHFPSVSVVNTEARVAQTTSAIFLTQEPQPLGTFLRAASRLRNFVALGLDQPISVNAITAYISQELADGKTYNLPLRIYGQYFQNSESAREIAWHRMLFSRKDLGDRLEESLQEWFKSYETLESPFNLFFGSKFGGLSYLDIRFLWLAQGIEALHRRTSDDTAMPEEEFQRIFDQLMSACPEEKKKWLQNRLTYANEASFRSRVRSIAEPFCELFPDSREFRSFVSRVVNTRNDLTHYSTRSEAKESSLHELWVLTQKLEAVFQLYLLRLIGLDYKQIALNKAQLSRKLRNL